MDNTTYIKISPEVLRDDLFTETYSGNTFLVYSSMTQVLSGGTNGTSLLTGLTIPIMLTQSAIDVGYYSDFDGFMLQKDVVTNFLFSATTLSPYEYYFYNTSDAEFKKFLDLSDYYVDWGDGSPKEQITVNSPQYVTHLYPTVQSATTFTITLEQTNPWGKNYIYKEVTIPYTNIVANNPNGTAYFQPLGGSWSGTLFSYDYLFTGDSENNVMSQISSKYVTVPFPISGTTKSRLTELARYGTPKYKTGPMVTSAGEDAEYYGEQNIDGVIVTGYTINGIDYYDYPENVTVYLAQSSGFTENDLVAVPLVKEEVLLGMIDQPQVQSDIFIERGKNSAYERIQRLGEVDNVGDLIKYGYGFFNIRTQ